MAAFKCNDHVLHIPTGLRGVVEAESRTDSAIAIRITHVPASAWFPQYGRPRIDDLMAFPLVELRRE